MKKLRKNSVAILGLLFFGSILFGVFQNFVFLPSNLYTYYLGELAKCSLPDYTKCSGEVINFSYAPSSPIGTFRQEDLAEYTDRDSVSYNVLSPDGFTIRYEYPPYFRLGLNAMSFLRTQPSVIQTIRATGMYSQQIEARDDYDNVLSVKESSSYFNPISQSNVDGSIRQKTQSFFNKSSLTSTGQIFHIIGQRKNESTVGGATKERVFNDLGLLQRITENGIIKEFEYDSKGNVYREFVFRDGVRRVQTTYSNYKFGIPQKLTEANGSVLQKVIDSYGQVVEKADQLGFITRYSYDILGRETLVTPPNGSAISFLYPTDLRTEKLKGNSKHIVINNAFGEIVENRVETAAETLVTSYRYDSAGRLKFKSFVGVNSPATSGIETIYNILDQTVTSKRTSDGSTTQWIYTSPDRVTKIDPLKFQNHTYFRNFSTPEFKQIKKVQQAIVQNPSSSNQWLTTDIIHNANGQEQKIIQGGQIRVRNYDQNTMTLSSSEDADTGLHEMSYYTGTQLIKSIKSPLGVAQLNYDESDRKIQTAYSDDVVHNFNYNAAGNLVLSSSPNAQKQYQYNANGNKISETLVIDGLTFTFKFEYDSDNLLSRIIYPETSQFNGGVKSQNEITFVKDGFGRITRISDAQSNILNSVTYWPTGTFKEISYANNTKLSMTLNSSMLPASINISSPTQSQTYTYKYDLNSNITEIATAPETRHTQRLTYDGLGRISSFLFPLASGLVPSGKPVQLGGPMQYDDVGNLTGFTDFASNKTVIGTQKNPLLIRSVQGDVNGDVQSDPAGNYTVVGNQTYEYTTNGKLKSLYNQGNLVAQYSYDASGLRVKKQSGADITYYFYSGTQLLLEVSKNKGVKEYIYFGNNLIAIRSIQSATSSYTYFHFNHQQSTIATSSPNGNLVFENYNPFGSLMEKKPAFMAATSSRFTGQYSDDDSGLIYMGQRYYHPKLGRFIQPDPVDFHVENPLSFNKYVYANNNPSKYIDPDGRLPIIIPLLLAGLTGYEIGNTLYGLYNGTTTRNEAAFSLAMAVIPLPVPFKAMPTGLKQVLVGHGASFAKDFPGSFIKVQKNVDVFVFNTMEGQAISPYVYEHMIKGNTAAFQAFRSMHYGPGTLLPNKILTDASADFLWFNKSYAPLTSVQQTTTLREALTNFSKSGGGCIGVFSCNGQSKDIFHSVWTSGFSIY